MSLACDRVEICLLKCVIPSYAVDIASRFMVPPSLVVITVKDYLGLSMRHE